MSNQFMCIFEDRNFGLCFLSTQFPKKNSNHRFMVCLNADDTPPVSPLLLVCKHSRAYTQFEDCAKCYTLKIDDTTTITIIAINTTRMKMNATIINLSDRKILVFFFVFFFFFAAVFQFGSFLYSFPFILRRPTKTMTMTVTQLA